MMKKVHYKDHGTTSISTNHVTLEHLEVLVIYHKRNIQSIKHMMFNNIAKGIEPNYNLHC